MFDDAGNNMLIGDEHWAVHEFGHAFVNAVAGRARPIHMLDIHQRVPGFPDRPDNGPLDAFWGFAGGRWDWQRSPSGATSEEFADMFLGWVYGQWEMDVTGSRLSQGGQRRADFMNLFMGLWLDRQL
jgi:hypothetical protein